MESVTSSRVHSVQPGDRPVPPDSDLGSPPLTEFDLHSSFKMIEKKTYKYLKLSPTFSSKKQRLHAQTSHSSSK